VTLDKSPPLSEPQFPCVSRGMIKDCCPAVLVGVGVVTPPGTCRWQSAAAITITHQGSRLTVQAPQAEGRVELSVLRPPPSIFVHPPLASVSQFSSVCI
jgi:hypothetical protein